VVRLALSRRRPALVRPVHLGFLGVGRFAAKAPDSERWISLDFLGFSRANRDFSMGYAGFSREEFFARLFRRLGRPPRRDRAVKAMRIRRIIHAASLARFLVHVNPLLSGRKL
jgi:hypothetical protein